MITSSIQIVNDVISTFPFVSAMAFCTNLTVLVTHFIVPHREHLSVAERHCLYSLGNKDCARSLLNFRYLRQENGYSLSHEK